MDSNRPVNLVVAVAASVSILTGKLRYKEFIRHENEAHFFNHCGIMKPVFKLLLKKLKSEMV